MNMETLQPSPLSGFENSIGLASPADTLYDRIRALSDYYEARLSSTSAARAIEMQSDDLSHHAVYRVLGVNLDEGRTIDLYQNKGRFLYNYAGAFLEEATRLCITYKFPNARVAVVPNTSGKRPKQFGIDCLVENGITAYDAFEIKWRDATTDGDHILKEHARLQAVHDAGYTPIRLMFYYPNREQARKVQRTLQTLYSAKQGHYYHGDEAWEFVAAYSGIRLNDMIAAIALEKSTRTLPK